MKALFAAILVFLIGFQISDYSSALAADEYKGEIRFVFKDLPNFYDYPDYESYSNPQPPKALAGDVDWDSYPNAWNFRTRLREGLKRGPNYAGKYAVIGIGCGTACQTHWIVNVENGKIIATVGSGGASFKIDSRLLIINLPGDVMNAGENGHSATAYPIDFYLIDDTEKLKLIKQIKFGAYSPVESKD